MVDLRFANSLQIMLTLAAAYEGEERLTSATLAGGVKVHPALVRRLLIPLAAAGLVETFKGKVGGARLGRSPKQINLRQIYEAAVDSELVCGPKKFIRRLQGRLLHEQGFRRRGGRDGIGFARIPRRYSPRKASRAG